MLRQILNKFGTTVYLQIWENRLKLSNTRTGVVFDEKPLVAIESGSKGRLSILAVGSSAAAAIGANIEIIKPFSHPRVLLADFKVGEKLLQYALREILGNNTLTPTPRLVVHPMEKTEGGLTMIEVRAFKELALGAGATDAVVYQGRVLSTQEIDFESLKEQTNE